MLHFTAGFGLQNLREVSQLVRSRVNELMDVYELGNLSIGSREPFDKVIGWHLVVGFPLVNEADFALHYIKIIF